MTPYTSILAQIAKTISTWEIQYVLRPFLRFSQLFILFLSLLTDDYKNYPKQAAISGGESFDYIIIGGGTAGCVLANRLSKDATKTVLLIEAGGLPSLVTLIPAFFPLFHNSKEEWGLYSTDDGYSSQSIKDKKIHMTAGKVLGGSSSATYLLYSRGDKNDFNRWAELGNEGWDWESVLPFFKKSESIRDIDIHRGNTSYLHGKDGPIHVTKPNWDDSTATYFEGWRQNGQAILEDVNGNISVGYGMSQLTSDSHVRQNTAITYIKPIRGRKNLSLLLNSLVTKILFNKNKEATGVDIILNNGKKVMVNAKIEVILCAGALNSPKILMLSGIGPKEHLEEHGINVIVNSPNVGQNFTDTPLVLNALTGKKGFLESYGLNVYGWTYLSSFPSALILGRASLKKNKRYGKADYQMNALVVPAGSIIPAIFCSSIFRYNDTTCISIIKNTLFVENVFAAHCLLYPLSRGSVRLRSADPKVAPEIITGYYSNPSDLERHAQSILDYVSVINTDTFKSFNSSIVDLELEKCKHFEFNTKNYWKCNLLELGSPQWNFAGTCSMGVEGTGVVDSRLSVRGVKKLRLVDASVIPSPVSGNYMAVVVMIAEKASTMIKEDHRTETDCTDE